MCRQGEEIGGLRNEGKLSHQGLWSTIKIVISDNLEPRKDSDEAEQQEL
jgi:hypothetical protein